MKGDIALPGEDFMLKYFPRTEYKTSKNNVKYKQIAIQHRTLLYSFKHALAQQLHWDFMPTTQEHQVPFSRAVDHSTYSVPILTQVVDANRIWCKENSNTDRAVQLQQMS